LPYINNRVPLLSFALKILNKLIRERDWSVQEVSYILLQLSVQMFLQQLVSLDCRLEDNQQDLIVLKSGGLTAGRPVLQRYRDRFTDKSPDFLGLTDLSLYDCLRL
jgi:hypothetical protein